MAGPDGGNFRLFPTMQQPELDSKLADLITWIENTCQVRIFRPNSRVIKPKNGGRPFFIIQCANEGEANYLRRRRWSDFSQQKLWVGEDLTRLE